MTHQQHHHTSGIEVDITGSSGACIHHREVVGDVAKEYGLYNYECDLKPRSGEGSQRYVPAN